MERADTTLLVDNAARWVARAPTDAQVRVGVRNIPGLVVHLKSKGIAAEALDGRDWDRELSSVNVLALYAHRMIPSDVAPIERWVSQGGGLLISGTGWADDRDAAPSLPCNRLLAHAGLAFGPEYIDRPKGRVFPVTPGVELTHAAYALDELLAQGKDHGASGGTGEASRAAEELAVVLHALRSVAPTDALLLPRLDALLRDPRAQALPSPEAPLGPPQLLARLRLARDIVAPGEAPEQVKASAAAARFPGAVAQGAPRLKDHAVPLHAPVPDWNGTGLYAPPGEVVRVTLPADATKLGLRVRIGCHTDELWDHASWLRAPSVSLSKPLTQIETKVANPFGGLVYIVAPRDKKLGDLGEIRIDGAVAAPRFVLGQTTAEQWKSSRSNPGPWAELETSKIILSVPSAAIRALADPEALLKKWDRVLDLDADLATIPRERRRPERMVADVQISVGYMHSGYPIMIPTDSFGLTPMTTDGGLDKPPWGHLHELGHNHQSADWTWEGLQEVTVNLFTLHAFDVGYGVAADKSKDELLPAARDAGLRKFFGGKADYASSDDVFMKLHFYVQLEQEFGWAAFKKVFAEYRSLAPADRPKTEDAKRDQWLVRFSRAVGRNLGPFFTAWRIRTSDAARASLASLPTWMPAGFPPK